MLDDDRVVDLLAYWQEQRDLGIDLSVNALCRGCPEVRDEVQEGIRQLQRANAFFGKIMSAGATPSPSGAPVLRVENGTSPCSVPRFQVLRPHRSGGLGEVFVAYDGKLHREVALKRIQQTHAADATSCQRFLREAEITGRLEHPGIVPVYDLVAAADGLPSYAMRLIQGETLKEAIERFHQSDGRGITAGEGSLAFRQLLNRFVDSLYNGSASSLMMQLLGNKKTSQKEIDEIKNLINKLDKRK